METFNVKPVEAFRMEDGDHTVELLVFESDAGETIVKVVTDNHMAGVGAEYSFIRHKFPDYNVERQALTEVSINGATVYCDQLTIRNEADVKKVFFDISTFFSR